VVPVRLGSLPDPHNNKPAEARGRSAGRMLFTKMKAAFAIHELDLAELQTALLLSLARIVDGDVVASEHRERIDGEAIQRPVAVTGNEGEPVRVFFLQ
jgi:hypothetical protein